MKRTVLYFSLLCLLFGSVFSLKAQSDFYETNTIQQINFSFEQENWSYWLDSLRFNGDELLDGTITINGQTFEGIGVRYRKSRSFVPGGNKNGLYVKLNHKNKGQSFQGHESIILSSALRDPSMIREVLALEIARKYMPAPGANFANVSVNDSLYGIFANIEMVEGPFLAKYFGDANGSLFLSNPRYEEKEEMGCLTDLYGSLQLDKEASCYEFNFDQYAGEWEEVMELSRYLKREPNRIEMILDVDRTLWMLAFNAATINLNSYSGQYSQNYFLYKNANGQFSPILWNLNLAFGSYKNAGTGSDLRTRELLQLEPLLHQNNPAKPLANVLLSNEEYRKIYLSHLRTIVVEHLADDKFEARAKELQALIDAAVQKEQNSYYAYADFKLGLSTTIGKRSKIPGLVDFAKKRASYLQSTAELSVLPSTISEINVIKRERFSSQMVTDFKIQAKVDRYAQRVKIYYRFASSEPFQVAFMHDDGKHDDGEAGDEVFGVQIQPQRGMDSIEYYIYAENARAVNFSPSNYMFEQHQVSLSELNK